jgi:hypothetical protein
MTEKKTPKRRTQVKDLPKEEKELSKEKQKKVKGGVTGGVDAVDCLSKPKQ